MCLVTRQRKPMTTKKDIVCYKKLNVFSTIYRSPIQSFVWIENKLETTTLGITKDLPFNVTVYDWTQYNYYKTFNNLKNRKLTVISEGFHAALDIDKLKGEGTIFKFLIPKGSLIFKDATGLVVSNQMMMLG